MTDLVISQVVTGGHYDVDVILTDPMRKVLYKQVKKQYDSFTWTAEKTGEYVACFSNEFSTFSHKLVYIDFQVSDRVLVKVILTLSSPRLVTRIHCQDWRLPQDL